MSCVGNGYLTGNMLIAFPFEDDQCLAWPDECRLQMQEALQRCFTDACISVRSSELPNSEIPCLGLFEVGDSSLRFSLVVGDAEKQISVVSTDEAFPIINGNEEWGSYVIVTSSEGIRDFLSLCKELSIAPPAPTLTSSSGRDGAFYLRLCDKCINVSPVGLKSLMVYDGVHPKENGPHFTLTGDVVLKPGNNMQYVEPDDEDNAIEVAAVPGAGLGRVACICKETVGGNAAIAGPDGHARLFNDTCYDLEPSPKFINDDGLETQQLKIHVKCTSCCTCAMYESIVNDRLVPLADAVRQAKSQIAAHHQTYELAVKKFNERISKPSLTDITLTLAGMPIGSKVSPNISNKDVTGNMSRCAFTAIVRNSSYFAVTASIVTMSGSDSVVEATAAWSNETGDPLSNTGDSALGGSYTIYPGRSLTVTFVTEKDAKVSKVSTGGFTGKFAVDLSSSFGSLGRLRKDVSV